VSDETFTNVSALDRLELSYNNLRTFDINILRVLLKLSGMYLYGNWLQCDCQLQEVWRWCEDGNITTGVGERYRNVTGDGERYWNVTGDGEILECDRGWERYRNVTHREKCLLLHETRTCELFPIRTSLTWLEAISII
jgi:hypothetical protein